MRSSLYGLASAKQSERRKEIFYSGEDLGQRGWGEGGCRCCDEPSAPQTGRMEEKHLL